ncbi:hypothetical protein TBK1r_64440 [Stieleria magnilauensis]|uniref:Uncharacterized protein n=1 Tax=Stieleria magnilauensis TaxID=2527963 RepID=A0ABX5Y5M3_9BACT|nr:hypothetical protein TBK1r_64440 [Planctomycetes bacterium TBK1r]
METESVQRTKVASASGHLKNREQQTPRAVYRMHAPDASGCFGPINQVNPMGKTIATGLSIRSAPQT